MNGKRALIVLGTAVVLAVPAGMATAAATSAGPASGSPAATQPAGPGYGKMMVGNGDRTDCPAYNSTEAQQWRDQRSERQSLSLTERQKLVEQHRDQMQQLAAATASP